MFLAHHRVVGRKVSFVYKLFNKHIFIERIFNTIFVTLIPCKNII